MWPYLLEFIVPEQYTRAIPIIAKSLGTLAEKMRDEDDEIYDLDYDVMVIDLQFLNRTGLMFLLSG